MPENRADPGVDKFLFPEKLPDFMKSFSPENSRLKTVCCRIIYDFSFFVFLFLKGISEKTHSFMRRPRYRSKFVCRLFINYITFTADFQWPVY